MDLNGVSTLDTPVLMSGRRGSRAGVPQTRPASRAGALSTRRTGTGELVANLIDNDNTQTKNARRRLAAPVADADLEATVAVDADTLEVVDDEALTPSGVALPVEGPTVLDAATVDEPSE